MRLTTYDILFSSGNKILNEIFEQEIGEFFTYQVQKGSVLKYLNWQIIQSKHGISIDQTSFLLREILKPYWKNTDHKNIYSRQNPFPMDTKFEIELFQAHPLEEQELEKIETAHNVSLGHWVGNLLHIVVLQDLTLHML